MPRGVTETVLRCHGALALRECAAKQQQQGRNVVRVAAKAHVEPVREVDRAFAQSQTTEPLMRRHVERRMLRQCPGAGTLQRVRAHRQHAVVVPRHVLSVGRRKIVGRMRWPIGLPNDFAPIHEVLLAKELEDRRHVHQIDAVTLGRADHARITGADIGTPRFRGVAQLAHRVNSTPHSFLCFEDENVQTGRLERQRRVQPGDARTHDHDIAFRGSHRQVSLRRGSSTPASAGFTGPGRPDRQQSAAHRS